MLLCGRRMDCDRGLSHLLFSMTGSSHSIQESTWISVSGDFCTSSSSSHRFYQKNIAHCNVSSKKLRAFSMTMMHHSPVCRYLPRLGAIRQPSFLVIEVYSDLCSRESKQGAAVWFPRRRAFHPTAKDVQRSHIGSSFLLFLRLLSFPSSSPLISITC